MQNLSPEFAKRLKSALATKPSAIYMSPSVPAPKGLLIPGNINLLTRPIIKNPDGSISTVRSASFEIDGKQVLIPTAGFNSEQEALQNYYKTGQHLGIFSDPEAATNYAIKLHEDYANGRIPGYPKQP